MEDDEQVRLLRELGCDQIQGYYVSRPVPAEGVDAMLAVEMRMSMQQRLTAA